MDKNVFGPEVSGADGEDGRTYEIRSGEGLCVIDIGQVWTGHCLIHTRLFTVSFTPSSIHTRRCHHSIRPSCWRGSGPRRWPWWVRYRWNRG